MTVRMGDFTNVQGGFPIEVGAEVIGRSPPAGEDRAGCGSREARWRPLNCSRVSEAKSGTSCRLIYRSRISLRSFRATP